MQPTVLSLSNRLDTAQNKDFVPCEQTESLNIACQSIEGKHSFKHLNAEHDELLYVISGELKIWTECGEFELKSGDLFKIPKSIEHGNLFGKAARILIIEGRL